MTINHSRSASTGGQPLENVFFFGCIQQAGHHLWDRDLRTRREVGPWKMADLDPATAAGPGGSRARACEAWMIDDHQREGEAVLSYRDGWTRLGWADRSVDRRRGSHANVIAEGLRSAEEMLFLGSAAFPRVFSRFSYPIVVKRTVGAPEAPPAPLAKRAELELPAALFLTGYDGCRYLVRLDTDHHQYLDLSDVLGGERPQGDVVTSLVEARPIPEAGDPSLHDERVAEAPEPIVWRLKIVAEYQQLSPEESRRWILEARARDEEYQRRCFEVEPKDRAGEEEPGSRSEKASAHESPKT